MESFLKLDEVRAVNLGNPEMHDFDSTMKKFLNYGKCYFGLWPKEDKENLPFNMRKANKGGVEVQMGDKWFSPQEISAKVLAKMKKDAEIQLNKKLTFEQPSKINARKKYQKISEYIKIFASADSYEIRCIKQALDGPEKGKENMLLKDMLLHAWPMPEDVDPVILTNRALSNNIFNPKERKL